MAKDEIQVKVIEFTNKKSKREEVEVKNRTILLEDLGLTELKLARSFMDLERNKDNWVYNATRKKWLYWNEAENIWVEDTDNKMLTEIAIYVETLSMEYRNYKMDDKDWNQIARAIVNFQKAQGLRNIANCCVVQAENIREEDLDRNPYFINFRNGTYNLYGDCFLPAKENATRYLLLSKRCEVDYDETAKCPLWEKALNDIFMGDQAYIDYIQRIFGYALFGENKEHAVFLIHGSGRNGKGLMFHILQTIMGSYFYQVPQNGFTSKGKDNPLIIADLYGKRFALLSETDRGAELATSLLKSISGGDMVSGRRHHELYFQYRPTFKVFIETNHLPAIYDDQAMWDRMHTIKFERYFAPDERDEELGDKLQRELSGILNWLLEGLRKYQERGLKKPPRAIEHTNEHRKEFDVLGQFLEECFVFTEDEDNYILPNDVYKVYCRWLDDNRLKGMNGRMFGTEIRKRKEITFKESKRIIINGKSQSRSCFIKMKEV